MNSHSTFFANYTIGSDAYNSIEKICKFYGKKIFLISGQKSKAQAYEKISSVVNDSNLEIVDCIIYGHECTRSNMLKCKEAFEKSGADMIFAVGGGKSLDTAKGCADMLGVPIFTFPTIASTCAGTTSLSVVYNDDGSFDNFYFFEQPANHTFIDLEIIANAPYEFLRAGMGDTLGKHFECHFAARGDELAHSSNLGREISNLCYKPLLKYGAKAISDVKSHKVTNELREIVLANIVSTGLVSLLVLDQYNCAVAHSVYYGLVLLKGFEEENLHGDVVGYGVLIQLAIDKNFSELSKVYDFLKSVGIRTNLSQMNACINEHVLKEIVTGPDMDHIPYPITENMVLDAINYVENLI